MGALTVMEDRLLTVDQIADRVQVSQETVRRWLRSGRMYGVRPGGAKIGWRVRSSEVDRFLAEAGEGQVGPES